MKNYKYILLFATVLASSVSVLAQNAIDALRFSQTRNLGTARAAAMGNAFTALGGDLSAAVTNPAGIGVFRKGQFSFTGAFSRNEIDAEGVIGKKNSFQPGNLGFVISNYNRAFDWRSINFGLSYTTLNNFNRTSNQSVLESPTSLLDVITINAGNAPITELNLNESLFYKSHLLNKHNDGYYSSVLDENDLLDQNRTIEERGSQKEITMSLGGNYKDKFFVGGAIGIQQFSYTLKSFYDEKVTEPSPSHLDGFLFDQFSKKEGVGLNFKVGMIYLPTSWLRLGAAVHTPTRFFGMKETIQSNVNSYFTEATDDRKEKEYSSSSFEYTYQYDLHTPWKVNLGIATVLGNRAILSADYEYIDYAKTRYSRDIDGYNLSYNNYEIENLYGVSQSFKLGAELRVNSIVSLRGGYNYIQNPNKVDYAVAEYMPTGNTLQSYSGGLGLNFGRFYADAAYVHSFSEQSTTFYYTHLQEDQFIEAQPINNKFKDDQVRITFGVRF